MTLQQLNDLKKAVGDLRFIQASALVASGFNEHKDCGAYMSRLKKLDAALDSEILNLIGVSQVSTHN